MSALFHGSRPTSPGRTYAAHRTNSATRGSGSASRWLTRAGLGEFNADVDGRGMMQQAPAMPSAWLPLATKKAAEAAFLRAPGRYFFAAPPRWANLLRNFSTRPPSESTL